MIEYLSKYLLKRQMKKLINLATELIYSEQFDIEILLNRLDSRKDIKSLLCGYIAINVASKLTEPLTKYDIDSSVKEVLSSSEYFNDNEEFDKILGLHKELAEFCLLEKSVEILERKLAYNKNEYSYDGIIYRIEKIKKKPSTLLEKEKFNHMANDVSEAEDKYEVCLDEIASKKAAEEALEIIKREVEEEQSNNGPKTKEELDEEFRNLTEQLKNTFKNQNDN